MNYFKHKKELYLLLHQAFLLIIQYELKNIVLIFYY